MYQQSPYPPYGGAATPGPHPPSAGAPGAPAGAYPQQGAPYPQYPQQQQPQQPAPGNWSPQSQPPTPGAPPPAQPYPSQAPDAHQPQSPQQALSPQQAQSPQQGQQAQQAQQPAANVNGAPLSGLMRMFGRKNAEPSASPQQQQPAPGAQSPSPERRGLLGLFGRSNNSSSPQPQQAQQGAPAGDPAQQGQPTVPVVPPAEGLCSRQPPPAEEVARLQSSPLAPSKLGLTGHPASPPAPGAAPGAGSAAGPPGTQGAGGAASLLNVFMPSRSTANPAVDPAFSGPPPLDDKFGPYLRFGGYDPTTRLYTASVMMVIHQSRSPFPPQLRYRDMAHRGSEQSNKAPLRLFAYAGYNFWRWDMVMQLGPAPATIEYAVVCSNDHFFSQPPRYHFQLPSAAQPWHWGFYSCNGFHDPRDEAARGGIQPLWRDVMRVHASQPLHALVGGGDQLYCDDVWKVPSLTQWTGIKDKPSRNAHPFSQVMANETYDYYFRAYTHHFGKEVFRDALASIPQVMMWDDHDIFDGWGSYPPELQNCPVFAGVFYVARKFFLLFQCHAAEDNVRQLNRGWGMTGLSLTRMLGSSVALIGLDSRGERTRDFVMRPLSWASFQDQVAKLPAGVRHVVVLATVPVIYPTVPCLEDAMDALAGTGIMSNAMSAFLQKTGLSSQIYSQFGEPELLDDLLDHWSAKTHLEEKTWFVHMMQDLAAARGLRFTLLSGDVHCAGVGCFHTAPKMNLKKDHRYVRQVISSAIGNVPPPDAVLKALSASNRPKMLDSATREKMSCIFENRTLLKGQRNWCEVRERPLLHGAGAAAAALAGGVSGGAADGALVFQLHAEHPTYSAYGAGNWAVSLYDIEVPVLELPPGTYSPGPLPTAPPMPATLMRRLQEEMAQAGVGLAAAQPPPEQPPPHTGAVLQPSPSQGHGQQLTPEAALQVQHAAAGHAPPQDAQQQQQLLQQQQQVTWSPSLQAPGQGQLEAPLPVGAAPPGPDQLVPQLQKLSVQSQQQQPLPPPPLPPQQQQQPPPAQQPGFGLQSEIHEHQEDQARAGAAAAAAAAAAANSAYPSAAASGSYPQVAAVGSPLASPRHDGQAGMPPPPLTPSYSSGGTATQSSSYSTGGAAPPQGSYPLPPPPGTQGQPYPGVGTGPPPPAYPGGSAPLMPSPPPLHASYSSGGAQPVLPPLPPSYSAGGAQPYSAGGAPPQGHGYAAYPQPGLQPPSPSHPASLPPQQAGGAYPSMGPAPYAPYPPAGSGPPGPNPYGPPAGSPYPAPPAQGPYPVPQQPVGQYPQQQQQPAGPYAPYQQQQQPPPVGYGGYGQPPAQPYMGVAPPGQYGSGYPGY